jgi:hypothetical protein
MNREEMEKLYEQLKVKYEMGSLTIDQFRTAMLKAKIRDSQGRFWIINPESGKWDVNAGGSWIEGTPPAEISEEQDTQGSTDAWIDGLRPSPPSAEEQPSSPHPSPRTSRKGPSATSKVLILAVLLVLVILVALALGAVLTNGFGIFDLGLW